MRPILSPLIVLSLCAPLAADPPADLSAELAKLLDGSEVPALAAAAVVKDEIVAAGVAGIRKAGDDTKATLEDKFHIGSNTKSMTASLAALLVRDGKTEWTATIDDSFSGFPIHDDYEDATLEQLLSNTAGCPKELSNELRRELFELRGALPRHRLHLAKAVLREKPRYEPGSGYEYSNAGFSIAGAMLERAARTEYEELLAERVFKPLGMESAGFRAPGRNRRVEQPYGHLPDPDTGELVAVDPEPRGDNPNALAPAGLVHCNIVDLAKYARAHLGHGPDGFLTAAELANLHRPRHQGEKPYALGWLVTEQPWTNGPALTHGGSNTMWHCVIWIVPGRDFAAVTAANSGTDEGFTKCDEAVGLLVRKFLAR